MTRKVDLVDSIKIAKPCPASWDDMKGDDRVRHCDHCKLNVYNIAGMTRVEAEALLKANSERLCVRIFRREDGRIMTADCPKGLGKVRKKVALALAAAVTAVFAVGFSFVRGSSSHKEQGWSAKDLPPVKKVLDWVDPPAPAPAVAMGSPMAVPVHTVGVMAPIKISKP